MAIVNEGVAHVISFILSSLSVNNSIVMVEINVFQFALKIYEEKADVSIVFG